MHDIRWIRENPDAFDAALARRGEAPVSAEVLALDASRRSRISAAEASLAERNSASKEVGAAKARGDEAEFNRLRELVASKKQEIAELEQAAKEESEKLEAMLMTLPNLPLDDVPDGDDEADNVEVTRWGNPRNFSFDPVEHFEVPAASHGMDFETAAKLSGSRFVVLSGAMVRLHRALAQFMLDVHTQEHGYTELYLPYLVNAQTMTGTGQLPKFGDDAFATTDEQPRYLIPTAEVPMTNMVADEILDADVLPLRFTSHTPCFRREAGSYGQDTRGMIRQHQFEKVELVQITRPADSSTALEELTGHAEVILQRLELPYRKIVLCTGDMGFSAAKTYDLEVWLPGQGAYREISSCSVCTDFQARRMKARWRNPETGKPELVHTLNGSGLAVGRTLIAVMENYQQRDGSIRVPEVLKPYMGGAESI
jgi:seryl-tRNA synthetase